MLQTALTNSNQNITHFAFWLAVNYHSDEPLVCEAARSLSLEKFLRLFVTYHGMTPEGRWQSHTYVRQVDSFTGEDHFFLIPIPRKNSDHKNVPFIRIENNAVWIDEYETTMRPQSIPHTTPFWYFHYNPNLEHRPFSSMTLNLSPACSERCTLCAGAKTGRVNNGMEDTLPATTMVDGIFQKYPEAPAQLDNVAIVTGCFDNFTELTTHLRAVRTAVYEKANPKTLCVLEHNITTEAEYDLVVGELGYDVYITLECFDQEMRNIALNGKVGRKGRDSREFIEMARVYANYLDARPHLGKHLVRLTYLIGIDSLEVTEEFFRQLDAINKTLKTTKVIPWLSIFTPYNDGMRSIQRKDYDLSFIYKAMALSEKYFGKDLMEQESGGTNLGYARGLY